VVIQHLKVGSPLKRNMKKKLFNIELSEEAIDDFDNSFNFYYVDSSKVADIFFNK